MLLVFTAGEVQATANIDTSNGLAYDMTITVSDRRNSGVARKLTIVITGYPFPPPETHHKNQILLFGVDLFTSIWPPAKISLPKKVYPIH